MSETISELFYKALEWDGPAALAHRGPGGFIPISHRELRDRVERLALALEARGAHPGDRLAILSENRPEWAVADYAMAVSGLVSVPVYPTLNVPQTAYILRHSMAKWVFCSTPAQLAKVLEAWADLPDLEAAVLMEGQAPAPCPRNVLDFRRLLEEGSALEDKRPNVRAKARNVRPGDLLTLIYTSGTTGDPKGTMLSHGNVASNVVRAREIFHLEAGHCCLSILPLSHIFERMGGHYTMLAAGVSIHYAESMQTVARDLAEVRPQILLAVPRIYEKFYAKVREQVAAGGLPSRIVFSWVVKLGRRIAARQYRDQPLPLGLRLARVLCDRLVFGKIRQRLGGRLVSSLCGGAAIPPKVLEFFWAAGVPLFEGYGLTETSPLLTLNVRGDVRPGSVGRPILDAWDGKPFLKIAPDGEILGRGPNVMLGYWRNPEATAEAIDAEGYFHTGDVGEMDPEGHVRITDRKKELLVTSGGKNVAPQPLENALRIDKYIEQAVVVGDGRNYLSALVVPDFAMLRRWADYKRVPFASDADLAARPEVYAKLMRRVDRVNARFSNYEHIRKIIVLDREITPESGLLTPSLKVRRRAVNEAFADRIRALYDEEMD